MANSVTAKERMLKSIRKALIEKHENPYPELDITPLYRETGQGNEIMFAEELTAVSGQFVYCEDELALIESLVNLADAKKWRSIFVLEEALKKFLDGYEFPYASDLQRLDEAEASITLCESLIARNGSILISTAMKSGRKLIVFPPVHVVVAFSSQLVLDIKDSLQVLKTKYDGQIPSSIALITGPSRTADIEKTLVLGAHGPKELYVFYVEQQGWKEPNV